ncbi:tetratricopeptide repeat protein [Pantoea stewartii]
MNKNQISAGICRALVLGGTIALSLPLQAAESSNPALQALFDQATYWHQKAHDDLAKASLQKVLMVEPDNTQALYLLALYSQQSGDNAGAMQYRARLSQVSPNDPHLAELDNARQLQSIPQAQLSWLASRRGVAISRRPCKPGAIPLAAMSRPQRCCGILPDHGG